MPCYRWRTVETFPEGGVAKFATREQVEKNLALLYPGTDVELTEITEAEADAVVAQPGDWLA